MMQSGTDECKLICPFCEDAGVIMLDDVTLDCVKRAREFARSIGLGVQFVERLARLDRYSPSTSPDSASSVTTSPR
jgi:hypothetical protein